VIGNKGLGDRRDKRLRDFGVGVSLVMVEMAKTHVLVTPDLLRKLKKYVELSETHFIFSQSSLCKMLRAVVRLDNSIDSSVRLKLKSDIDDLFIAILRSINVGRMEVQIGRNGRGEEADNFKWILNDLTTVLISLQLFDLQNKDV
jgi:hypothetical protein